MNHDTLKAAIREARRFLEAAAKAEKAFKEGTASYSPKETGAARRASMDLTRALADLRRPG